LTVEILHRMIVEEMSQLAFNALCSSRDDPSEGSRDLSPITILQTNQDKEKRKEDRILGDDCL
jgi:hypothetical protein